MNKSINIPVKTFLISWAGAWFVINMIYPQRDLLENIFWAFLAALILSGTYYMGIEEGKKQNGS